MIESVLVYIENNQFPVEEGTPERTTSRAQGTCLSRDGIHRIHYEEKNDGDIISNLLLLTEEEMTLKRSGSLRAVFRFIPDQLCPVSYQTSFGELSMAVHTSHYHLTADMNPSSESLFLIAEVSYRLIIESKPTADCQMIIRISHHPEPY